MYVFLSQMRSRICWEEPDLLPLQQALAQDTTTTLDDDDDEQDGGDDDGEDDEREDGQWEDDEVDTDVLPTLLVYRGGELAHSWVRVDWEAKQGIEELLRRYAPMLFYLS